jgi:hypothetical protein
MLLPPTVHCMEYEVTFPLVLKLLTVQLAPGSFAIDRVMTF